MNKCWTLNAKVKKKKKQKKGLAREMMVLEEKFEKFVKSSNKRL